MKTKSGKKSAQKAEPTKVAKPAKPVKKEESSSDDDDESEEEPPKAVSTTPKQSIIASQKKQEKMEVDDSDDSDDDDGSSEEAAPVNKSVNSVTAAKKVAPAKKADSSDESDSDSSESDKKPVTKVAAAPVGKKTAAAVAVAQKTKKTNETSDDDDSSEEETKVQVKQGVKLQTTKSAKKESSSDEDDSEEEEEEEEKPPGKGKAVTSTPVAKKQKEPSSSEEDDEEDESSEEETSKVPTATQKTKQTVPEEESAEDSDEEDDDDDEEEEEEEDEQKKLKPNGRTQNDDEDDEDDDEDEDEEEAQKPGEKRKAKELKVAAKKAKIDNEEKGSELFVKGIPEGVQEKKLTNFFKKQDIKFESLKLLDRKGICFVHLSEEMSSSEVDKLNGIEFDGNSLTIEIAQKRDNSFSTPRSAGKGNDGGDRNERDKRTLFVRNLPYGTDEDSLAEHFKGSEEVRLPRNDDGKIRGIGFIQFGSEADALKALKKYNNTDFGGRKLSINQAGSFGGGQNSSFGGSPQPNQYAERDKRSLFVGNLSWGVDESAVSELFEGCKAVRVPKRDDGKVKGFAFVEYGSEAEAVKAMEQYQGADLDGREISIERCSEKQGGGGGRGGGRGGRGGGRGFGGRGGGGRGGGRGGFDRGRGGRGGRGGFRGGRGGETQQKNKGFLSDSKASSIVFDD